MDLRFLDSLDVKIVIAVISFVSALMATFLGFIFKLITNFFTTSREHKNSLRLMEIEYRFRKLEEISVMAEESFKKLKIYYMSYFYQNDSSKHSLEKSEEIRSDIKVVINMLKHLGYKLKVDLLDSINKLLYLHIECNATMSKEKIDGIKTLYTSECIKLVKIPGFNNHSKEAYVYKKVLESTIEAYRTVSSDIYKDLFSGKGFR